MIKEYFANYYLHTSDVTFDFAKNDMQVHQSAVEPWRVTLVETGEDTMTGGRLLRVLDYVGDEDFCFTYGDGVADVDLAGAASTSTASRARSRPSPPCSRWAGSARCGSPGNALRASRRSRAGDEAWINGGFFVVSPRVADYLEGRSHVWEEEPLQRLAADGELSSYRHSGFWQPMDTLREKDALNELWDSGAAPWKTWD